MAIANESHVAGHLDGISSQYSMDTDEVHPRASHVHARLHAVAVCGSASRLRVRRSPVLDSHAPCDSVPFWGLALLLRSLVCVRRLMSRGRWCNPTEAGEGEVMLLKELMVG
jgi:hypothetical protein